VPNASAVNGLPSRNPCISSQSAVFQLVVLRRGFDTFGDHVHLEGVCERDDRRDDRAALLTVRVQTVCEEARSSTA
jgi:hypothetical protein